MSISQPKVDMAVLWKLYCHSEHGGESITPSDLQHLFGVQISVRRIGLALKQLESDGLVDNEYHPHYSEVGLWAVTREGLVRVERALKTPASFIFRLNANGDGWLETDEAQAAVLKKLNDRNIEPTPIEPEIVAPASPLGAINISNIFSPATTQDVRTAGESDGSGRSAALAGWINVWVALIVGIIAILVALWIAGKI